MMVTDLDRQAAFGAALAAYEDATSSSWIEPLEVAVNVAIDVVAPLIAAQAHREAFNVAHAFARTGVDGILARLVDLLDGEIRPSDAVAQARREALEEAARLCDAAEERIMAKLRKLERPNADLAGAAAVGGADTAERLARRIRALADKPKETTPW